MTQPLACPVIAFAPPLLQPVGPWVERHLPSWLSWPPFLGLHAWQWLGLFLFALAALVAGAVLQAVIVGIGGRVARRASPEWGAKLVAILPGPTRVLLALFLFHLATPLLSLPEEAVAVVNLTVRVLLIVAATWLVLRFLTLASELIEAYLVRQTDDPGRIRSVQTQVAVPRGILRFVIVLVGIALVLLQFEVVRSVGVSLLASAGLAGIIIGLAAQRTISNLLAGIQLAVFQPVRIGDTVVVEGEFGWVEEIGLTYVVVKIWDLRRLILPVSHLLEQPFQNWTRGADDLLGTVFLYTDYAVPVEEVRGELRRILEGTELWDRRAQGLLVTNLTDHAVELRALVSARDAGRLFELRCLVRERLLAWLQARGECLPVQRVELLPRDGDRPAPAAAGPPGAVQ